MKMKNFKQDIALTVKRKKKKTVGWKNLDIQKYIFF